MIKKLSEGTEIYYAGDMANSEGFGLIVKSYTDKWGSFYNIDMKDGRKINGLSVAMFSDKYLGHGGTRFVTREAYNDYRKEAIQRLQKSLVQA